MWYVRGLKGNHDFRTMGLLKDFCIRKDKKANIR